MRFQQSQTTVQPELLPKQPLHLLIVEDVFADVELITLTLEAAGLVFTYDQAETAIACQQLLRSQTYDAVLSDYRLPGFNGLDVLEILQQSEQTIPLILVTGTLGEEAAVECIKAGMTDYVLKERLFRLPTVLARALQEFELRRAKRVAQEQIQRQAWREATINRIVQAMRGTLVLEEVLQTTVDQLHQVLQVSCCLICQSGFDDQMRACYISQATAKRQSLIGAHCNFALYYRKRLSRGESVVVDRIDANLTLKLQKAARDCDIRSLIVTPLLYQQSYWGEIALHQCDREREWTVDEVALVTAIADQCAIAIHQAQLYQQAQTELSERKRLEGILRHQAEQLVQANRLKDEFLAVVSHELRTPLSTILCWAQLLRNRKVEDPTLKKAIEGIERSAKTQVKIVNDLLDVSRIMQGKIELHLCSVELIPIILSVVEEMRPTAEAKSIQVETVLDPSVGSVFGDPNRLQQLVWNLLSNAVKFTPVGGRVNVELMVVNSQSQGATNNPPFAKGGRQRTTNKYAQLQVSDTGIGISPGFLPHVFDRFRQADSTITREYGGLGLGLAIAYHLVELHGGTIRVTSEGEAKGTTVTVKLPCETAIADH